MPGILKMKATENRFTLRLTVQQQKFKKTHPNLNFSEIIRRELDKFIHNFDEDEYRRMTR